MNIQDTVTALRNEVTKNPVFKDVAHVFAFRQRARNQLTVSGLSQRMIKEGFEHPASEYIKIIRFLASLGLGKLETPSGKVTGLKDVRITLQSIGKVAVGEQGAFISYKQRNRYQELANKAVVKEVWKAPESLTKVTIALEVSGSLFKLEVPTGLTTEALAEVIKRLQGDPGANPRQGSAA